MLLLESVLIHSFYVLAFYYTLFILILIMTLPVSKLIIKYLLNPSSKGNTSTVYFNNYYLYSGENILCYIVPIDNLNTIDKKHKHKYKNILFINYRFINSNHIKFLLTYINSNKGLRNKFFIYYVLNIPYSFKGLLSFESILLNTEKYLLNICCNKGLLLNSEVVQEYCILFRQFNYLYKYYYNRNPYYKLRNYYSYCLNRDNNSSNLKYYKVKMLSNIK